MCAFNVFLTRKGWTDSSKGVCVRVCWKGGGEEGSKAQDAAQRASGDFTRTCSSIFTCSNEESFRNTAFLWAREWMRSVWGGLP